MGVCCSDSLLLPRLILLLQGSMAVNNTHFKGSWRPEEDAALRECVAGLPLSRLCIGRRFVA